MSDRTRRTEIEAWWPLIARIVGFVFGLGLGSFLILTGSEATWPYILVIGMLGLTVATPVAVVLQAMRGGGSGPAE